jgi:hypothetical protein
MVTYNLYSEKKRKKKNSQCLRQTENRKSFNSISAHVRRIRQSQFQCKTWRGELCFQFPQAVESEIWIRLNLRKTGKRLIDRLWCGLCLIRNRMNDSQKLKFPSPHFILSSNELQVTLQLRTSTRQNANISFLRFDFSKICRILGRFLEFSTLLWILNFLHDFLYTYNLKDCGIASSCLSVPY